MFLLPRDLKHEQTTENLCCSPHPDNTEPILGLAHTGPALCSSPAAAAAAVAVAAEHPAQ